MVGTVSRPEPLEDGALEPHPWPTAVRAGSPGWSVTSRSRIPCSAQAAVGAARTVLAS